jgi:hypothetical protein
MPREKYLEKTTLDEKKRKEEDDYWEQWDSEKENGVGCRCRCDTDIPDVEGKQGSCLAGESLQPDTFAMLSRVTTPRPYASSSFSARS